MFSGWTIQRRLYGAFALVTGVLVVLSCVSWVAVGRLTARSGDALAAAEGSQFVTARYGDHLRWVHELDLHLLGAHEFSGQLDHTKCRLGQWLYDAEARQGLTDEQLRRLVSAIEPPHVALHASAREVLAATARSSPDEARALFLGKTLPALAAAGTALTAVQERFEALRAEQASRLDAEARLSRVWTAGGSIAAVLLAVLLAWLVSANVSGTLRRAVGALRQGAEEVTGAAGQIATSAQSLSQGATEQAASLEETSASMEEMAAMTRRNAEQSQQAAALMGEVDRQVAQSNAALHAMVGSMASIQESSTKVSKIIKTIDEIAFQTNILALNAAVEAARAGEAGMGFAVVADEVRNLAQRSAQAAKDTAGLIEESSANAAQGTAKVDQVAASITAITGSVAQVKELVEGVSLASKQQAQGIDQVTQAVSQMEKVTQTTAATAEESAAASEELNAQAEQTMAAVRSLATLVGETERAATAVRAARHATKPAAASVLTLARSSKVSKKASDAEAEAAIPLGDTGTFGKF